MRLETIVQGFARCAAAYRGLFTLPSDGESVRFMAEVWLDALAGYDDERVAAAFATWCASEIRPPTPADLAEKLKPMIPEAAQAWEETMVIARSAGYGDGSVPFDLFFNRLAARAADGVSWAEVCGVNLPADNQEATRRFAFTRREFERRYNEIRRGESERQERELIEGRPLGALPNPLKSLEAG